MGADGVEEFPLEQELEVADVAEVVENCIFKDIVGCDYTILVLLCAQQHGHIAKLEVAQANFEATQRQLMEIIGITRDIIGSPISSGDHWIKLSLEYFRQHHPAKFTEKCLPDEVEKDSSIREECDGIGISQGTTTTDT
ncbi:hypothetical protein LR48_Vigan10g099100 [Vigna angularis]|uniref:Uncharacterized protein n=1 Tax=Phaseolus angularis TaxID=3914 RepID=A0A0L9VK60_PHAAN|nr:hypothetical protein LR48_Vigan10g099100 [Vigna angularis]